MPMTPHPFSLPFVKKEQVASDTFSFFFDRREANLDFLPGQHVRMTLDLPEEDSRGKRRFFSISSSPLEKKFLIITTKIEKSASMFKKTLFALSPEDTVQFWGPAGVFLLPENTDQELVFLAGGIGVTPFHSMLSYLAEKKKQQKVTLFVSFKHLEEMVFYSDFQKICHGNDNLRVVYTLTQAENMKGVWEGRTERISESLLSEYLPDLQRPLYYACGSLSMVDAMLELLEKLEVPSEQIKKEYYPGY